ncbi:MAG: transposase [Deltaproteobacteria bacterium]|nr:transposase [Deltaproteobacteria bacterium]
MPRGPRLLPAEGIFHLIARANHTVRAFRQSLDFIVFKKRLLRFSMQAGIMIHHYVLMNTHFHLLARVDDTKLLAPTMKALLLSYHHYYRRKYAYKGHLWHSRYRSIIIANEEQKLQCARYIELNPVHAKLCNDPQSYRWSSYHHYAFGTADELIVDAEPTPRERLLYQQFVVSGIDLDYQHLKKQYERGQ